MTALLSPPLSVDVDPRRIAIHFGELHDVAGWAIVGGGLGRASSIAIFGVKNAELGPDVDPATYLRARLREARLEGSVGMMTSRSPLLHHRAEAQRDGIAATAIVTAGLGNALRVGDPACTSAAAACAVGTINAICRVSVPLSIEARLEAISIAVEARSAAVMAHPFPSVRSGLDATGTGTDCVTIASPARRGAHHYAGKHTALGEVIGRATFDATEAAVMRWLEEKAR